ncbi:MAG: hypothetical protein WCJ56_05220 [bacterium]
MSFTNVKMRTPDGAEYGPVTWDELQQWHQQGRVPPGTLLIDADTGEEKLIGDFSQLSVPAPMIPPPPQYYTQQQRQPNHLIPTQNPQALWAYYLSIGSFICCGPLLGIPAVILGILGLGKAREVGEGKTHSIVGIVLGSITSLGYIAFWVFLFIVNR